MKMLAVALVMLILSASSLCAEPQKPSVVAAVVTTTSSRPAVEGVMRAMEAAAVAGDAAAFMLLMDPTDPVFLQEQQELANDWSKNKVAALKLSVVEPDPALPLEKPAEGGPEAKPVETEAGGGDATVFGADKAMFRMKMVWKMEKWKAERDLTVPVVFTKDAASGQWRYAGEQWEEVVGPPSGEFNGVRILFEPGNSRLKALAADIVKVMPKVRATVDDHFKTKVPGTVTVKLYRSMKHLQASIWLSYTDSLGGWNEPHESIKLLTSNRTTIETLSGTLAHEYGHCVTFTMGPAATSAAWWALEGAADYAATEFKGRTAKRRDDQVARWMRDGKIGDWSRMVAFPLADEDRHLMTNIYVQGEHMMAFLDTRYGRDARIAFVRALCEGKSTEQAALIATGQSWADVDTAWRQSIQMRLTTEPAEEK